MKALCTWGLAVVWLSLCSSGLLAQVTLKGRVLLDPSVKPIMDTNPCVYHVQRALARPVIDGKVDEWAQVPAMVLDKKEQAGSVWNGPKDLSGSLRIQWDDQGLYFCLQVTDDVHSTPFADDTWWANDGCQFVFDPHLNGNLKGYDVDELSYVLCDSVKGPLLGAYRIADTANEQRTLLKDLSVKMSMQTDGTRVYEWAMPWGRVAPVSPWLLGRCGFSWSLNDNDAADFKNALFWTPGVIYGQDASKLGQIVFDGATEGRSAFLGLRPESKINTNEIASTWMSITGVDPFGTARLIVRSGQAKTVEASVKIFRPGERNPVARGTLKQDLAANQLAVFVWDVKDLPSGSYEIVYDVPALQPQSMRMTFFQLVIPQLKGKRDELSARFGLDRPWDPMTNAPALIRRHRGMMAVAREVFGSDYWTKNMVSFDRAAMHHAMLEYTSSMVKALEDGKDFLGEQRGFFWLAYFSPADGSGQLFVVNLPSNFDPAKTYPLIIGLHGYSGIPLPLPKEAEKGEACIEVMPWGRGSNGYRGLGETDVLEVLRYMQQWYKIDAARTYLTGTSMGGGGTWRLATQYPDLFAAVAPLCGSNFRIPLENLRHVPVLNQHGMLDWVVPLDTSRYGVSQMEKMGYTVVHNELPDAGHNLGPLYPINDWLLAHKRPESPATVTLTCPTPEQGRAYWANILEFAEPHAMATVNAKVDGHGPQQSLTLGLENVAVLGLEVARMPLDRQADLLIQAGFELLKVKAPLPNTLYLAQKEGRWTVADKRSLPATVTRAYRPGAAANLYDGEPLMIVYGSRGSEARTRMLREAAEKLVRWAGEGDIDTTLGQLPVKADKDVSAEDLSRYNVLLIGNAQDSELAARILPKLPLQVSDQNILTVGSREPFNLAGAGIRMFYYNPFAPKRLVFWVSPGAETEDAAKWLGEPGALLSGSSGYNRIGQADLIVQNMTNNEYLCYMQLTHDWQWRKLTGLEGGDRHAPEAMAGSEAYYLAHVRAIRQVDLCDFALAWRARPESGRLYDHRTFTRADLAMMVAPDSIMFGSVTGQELSEIVEKCITTGKIAASPAIDPKTIDTNRTYRLALPPSVSWALRDRQKNLREVEAAPDIPVQAIYEELVKE